MQTKVYNNDVFICRVPAFEASKFMITNGEYLEFVESGGYEDEKFWTEEGWKWKVYRQSKHPVFWVCNHGKFRHPCLLGL